MSRSFIAVTALTLVVTACTDPTMPHDQQPQFAKGAATTNLSGRWTFENALADGTIAGIRSDGRGSYQDNTCGVMAQINAATTGDGVFDADYKASGRCAPRKLHIYFDGATATALGPLVVSFQITQLAVGESRRQRQGFRVDLPGCERLRFDGEDGLGGAVVRRVDARTWRVESVAPHVGYCWSDDATKTTVSYTLPFAFTIVNVSK